MQTPKLRKPITPVNLVYFALGLAVLVFLLRQVDLAELVRLMRNIKISYLLVGGLIYFLKAVFRTLRFLRANPHTRPRFMPMLRLTLATSLASQLLPLKLGEFSYVYLIKKDTQTPVTQGLSSLLIIRIFDLLAIALLFLTATALSGLPSTLSVYFSSVVGFAGLLIVLIFTLIAAARVYPVIVQRTGLTRLFQKITLLAKLNQGMQNLFLAVGAYRVGQYWEFAGLSLAEWLVNYGMYHVVLWGMGLQPRLFDTVVAVSFAALASVIPINSFGNFGTQEAGWATGLVLLGYAQATALTSGFATHLLSLAYMLAMGGISWVSYLIDFRSDQRTAAEPLNR